MSKNCFIRASALIIAVCLLFSSCSNTAGSSLNIPSSEIISPEALDNKFHTFSSSSKSVKSDFLSLDFDETSYSLSVTDLNSDFTWYSLPQSPDSGAFTAGVTLYSPKGIYSLNSQDNSVGFGTASYEVKDNTITVSYKMSDSSETAKKSFENITKDDIFVSLSVVYTVSNQTVTVSIDCSSIQCAPGSFIGSISLLPYFGASYSPAESDYIFVPDGSGAIMKAVGSDENTDTVSIAVYGQDPALGSASASSSASMPVFGIKSGINAFAAVIKDGDALATINASRKTENSPAKAGASFTLTPVYIEDGSQKVVYGASYDGNITVAYKFLAGANADYIGMASAAREEFIEMGYISSQVAEQSDSIPFFLTVAGGYGDYVLATASQTQDMLGVLKGKGINNIILRYKGLLSGGLNQKSLYSSKINGKLGGESGLESLYTYTRSQNYKLFTDINIFSSSSKYLSGLKAENLKGENSVYSLKNNLALFENTNNRLASRIGEEAASAGAENSSASLYAKETEFTRYLMSITKLPDKFTSLLSGNLTESSYGISLNDAGYVLYSDNGVNRQDAKEIIESLTKAVPAYSALMVDTGNIYTVYNAEIIANMAFDTYYRESDSYKPVPFAQAVLHGYSLYTGKPIDAADPLYRYTMLQYIEYGAMPSFEWVFDESSIFYYGYYVLSERISEIVEFYDKANEMLSYVSGSLITGHREIGYSSENKTLTGVYCTTYSNGAEIYVNYTGSVVTTSGNIVIAPYDCVLVKR